MIFNDLLPAAPVMLDVRIPTSHFYSEETMLVKDTIKKDWFKKFLGDSEKSCFESCAYYLNIDDYHSFGDFFENEFKYNKIKTLELIFPQIQKKSIVSDAMTLSTFGEQDNFFGVVATGSIKDFSRITSFEIDEYGIFEHKESNKYDDISLTSEIGFSSLELQLNSFNQLNGQFSLVGYFSGESLDYYSLGFLDAKLHAKIRGRGLLKNKAYPFWIEYLIDSIFNYDNEDHKMSILNIYSAFENFISTIHDTFIFEYLAHLGNKGKEELDRLRNFSQNRKNFFLKVNDVVNFFNISNLEDTIKKLESYEHVRHRIAHGATKNNDLSNEIFDDLAFHIIVIIISISTQTNILQENNWKNKIKEF